MARNAAGERYAKALFQLAQEEGRTSEVRAELGSLVDALTESQELRDVLLQPIHPAPQRQAVLAALAERLGASETLRSFYSFLIDQRRLVDAFAIREAYDRLVDAERGVTQVEVRTAQALDDAQLERLRGALSARTGGEVSLDVEVDPELLGGVVAKVGDLLFDGSIRSQLAQMRASLLEE